MQLLRKCSRPSFLEIGVLLLVHRLNPDVGVVGEYVSLELLGLEVWLKVMFVSKYMQVVVGEVGERTHELVFTSLVYY